MKRTLDEWQAQIENVTSAATRVGVEWSMLVLLSYIAIILLDIREMLLEQTATFEIKPTTKGKR